MNLSDKELRKMLNAAWDRCRWRSIYQFWIIKSWNTARSARYRDVTKIIKEWKEKEDA